MSSKNQSFAFKGRGKVYFTPVKNGVEGETFWAGVVSAQTFNTSVDNKQEMREYHTGKDQVWEETDGDTTTTMSLTIKEHRAKTWQMALKAGVEKVASDSVAGESHTVVGKGSIVLLNNAKVDSVAVTDSNSQPLVVDVDYKLNKDFGRLEMLTDGHTSPLLVDYTYGEKIMYKPMSDNVDYYKVRTEGLNLVGQKGKHLVNAHKFKPDPMGEFGLINDDFDSIELSGTCLYDEEKDSSYDYAEL